MSIAPVSGIGSGTPPPAPVAQPDATDAPGAAERDGDGDDSGAKAPAALTTPALRGRLDIKA
jgi:hypothetical protein